uniref:F-box domain-containing protein n=1 Tax=Haemonchus placei TaxID=6290 RepID=A0A0N4X5Q9_HAEPC
LERDSLKSFLSPKANRCLSPAFNFFGLPIELQLLILNQLSSRDLNSCRLTCQWMNQVIVENWSQLRSREIGCVDFIPGCQEIWGLYYDYSKKLTCFQHSIISRLVVYYGIITSSLLKSLSKTLSDLRISVKTLIIHNCRCDCTVSEFINFIVSANVEVLAIDVFEMRAFGQSIANDKIIRDLKCSLVYVNGDDVISGIVVNCFYEGSIELSGFSRLLSLKCSLVYVNGDDVISGIVVNCFYEGSIELSGFSRLLSDWGDGCIEILHFHMKIDDDAAHVATILEDSVHFRFLHGCVLKNGENQELFIEAKDGRLTLTPIRLSVAHQE